MKKMKLRLLSKEEELKVSAGDGRSVAEHQDSKTDRLHPQNPIFKVFIKKPRPWLG